MFKKPNKNLSKEELLEIIKNYTYNISTLLIKGVKTIDINEFSNFNIEFIQFNLIDYKNLRYNVVLEFNEDFYNNNNFNYETIKSVQLTYKQEFPIESYISIFNLFELYPIYVENNKGKI